MRLTSAPRCARPRCSSGDTIGNGARRFLCRGCGRSFSRRTPFPRSRFPAAVIFEAVALSGAGFRPSVVVAHMKRAHRVSVSHQTVFSWRAKFGEAMRDYSSGFSRTDLSLSGTCSQISRDSSGLFPAED